MDGEQGLFMKEKVLKQENQISSKDGLTCTKVESTRQQYLSPKSSKSSEDPGLVLCRKLVFLTWTLLDCPMRPHKDSAELWIRHTHGAKTLKEHRDVPRFW